MNDLVKRLRMIASMLRPGKELKLSDCDAIDAAASEIERLRDALRGALWRMEQYNYDAMQPQILMARHVLEQNGTGTRISEQASEQASAIFAARDEAYAKWLKSQEK